MKISPEQIKNLLQTYTRPSEAAARPGVEGRSETNRPSDAADKVDISDRARLVHKVRAELAKVPEVREERVRELQKAVEQGTYHVSSEEVAEKMLGRVLGDRADKL